MCLPRGQACGCLTSTLACSQKKIRECGFEKVKGWESLYVHKKLQVFLGVYVDDFHLSGVEGSLTKAWELLKQHIDFSDITKFEGTTYLGCTQEKTVIPEDEVKEKSNLFSPLLKTNKCSTAEDYEMKPVRLASRKKPKSKMTRSTNIITLSPEWTANCVGYISRAHLP